LTSLLDYVVIEYVVYRHTVVSVETLPEGDELRIAELDEHATAYGCDNTQARTAVKALRLGSASGFYGVWEKLGAYLNRGE